MTTEDGGIREEVEEFARSKGYRIRMFDARPLAVFGEHEVENRPEGNEGPWACPLCDSGDFSWPLSFVNHVLERHTAKAPP